jgi:hypothetical protein
MDADVERLLTEEEVGWAALIGAFDAVPQDRFEEGTLTPEGWSPKDLMFHVAAWCGECDTHLERMRTDTLVDDDLDTDTKNRNFFEVSKGLDAPTVRAELLAVRTRMREALRRFERITPSAQEWFEESGAIHYGDHVRDLSAWKERA